MNSIFDDAVKAYDKYCEENNFIFSQPSEILSEEVEDRYFDLYNSKGFLARYEIETGQILEP